jgi:membrane fusion protein (multidrug efflux system)
MEKELAMVEAELGYARGVGARSERLVGVGAISRQEFENDLSMAAGLEAKREAARARLEQARAMEGASGKKLEAADAMIAQSAAALRTATVMRDYVTIEAPSQGYVVKRLVAPGVLVQPGMAILKIAPWRATTRSSTPTRRRTPTSPRCTRSSQGGSRLRDGAH